MPVLKPYPRATHSLQAIATPNEAASALGSRLRVLRLARGWTLEDTSRVTELSRSAISKIERGDVTPSFDALLKLSKGFNVEVSDLLDGSSRLPPEKAAGRRSVVRGHEGVRHSMEHYDVRMLVADVKHPAFTPYEFVAKGRSPQEFSGWDRHDSEDFIFVLSGTMILHSELYEPLELKVNDSLYFDARMGHLIISAGKSAARALCISGVPRS